MYQCEMFRIILILQLSFASFGFLLNTKAPSSSNGKDQYITVAEYYADKASLRHEMERTLNLLTSQIEQRLFQMQSPTDSLERKYNETFENLTEVSAKLETTEARYKFLEQKYATLEKVVQNLESEVTLEKKNLREVKVRLSNIEQSQSINQILELNQMREKVRLMENSVNQLQGNEQSRNQDFLALYNITLIEKNNIAKLQHKTELQENYLAEQNATYSKEISILYGRASNHDNQLLILKNETEARGYQIYLQNQNCTDQINYLQNKTNQQNQQFTSIQTEMLMFKKVQAKQVSVGLLGCYPTTQTIISGAVVKFSSIEASTGIHDLTSFSSSGKFTCQVPGFYMISVVIMSRTDEAHYKIEKNNKDILGIYPVKRTTGWATTSTSVVSTNLIVNDTVYVKTYAPMSIEGGLQSCISIIKA